MGRGFEPHTSPQQYQGLSVSDPLGPFVFGCIILKTEISPRVIYLENCLLVSTHQYAAVTSL